MSKGAKKVTINDCKKYISSMCAVGHWQCTVVESYVLRRGEVNLSIAVSKGGKMLNE